LLHFAVSYGLSSAGEWPIATEKIDERRARYEQQATPAILTGDGHLITGEGVAKGSLLRATGRAASASSQHGPD
jgi:hypothetical protein